jgi:hypothetical protein
MSAGGNEPPRVRLNDNHGTLQVAGLIVNGAHPADFSALSTADVLAARNEHFAQIDAYKKRSTQKRRWLAAAMLTWGLGWLFVMRPLLPAYFAIVEIVAYIGGMITVMIADSFHTQQRDAWMRVALIRLGAMDEVLIRRRDWVMPAEFQPALWDW